MGNAERRKLAGTRALDSKLPVCTAKLLSERGKVDDGESKSFFSLCVDLPVRSWWRWW